MFFIVIAGNFYQCTPYPVTFQVVKMIFDCERSSKKKKKKLFGFGVRVSLRKGMGDLKMEIENR